MALLYAHRKKEKYEAMGIPAIVHRALVLGDDRYEVYAFPKERTCRYCNGSGKIPYAE